MKEENQHIDELFRDGLSGFEVSPPEESWNAILSGLEKAKRKRTLIFLMRAAAIGLIIFGLGAINYLSTNINLPTNHVTFNESRYNANKNSETENINTKIEPHTTGSANATLPQNSKTIADHHSDIPKSQVKKNSVKSVNKPITSNNARHEKPKNIAFKEVQNRKTNISRSTDNQAAPILALRRHFIDPIQTTLIISPGLAGNSLNTISVPSEKEIQQRWSVGGQATPLYAYREVYPSGFATISQEYFNDVETPVISYSAGLNLSYKASHRLSIESGVYYARLGNQHNNVYLVQRDKLNLGETYLKAGTRVLPVVNSYGPIIFNNNMAGAEEKLLGSRDVTLFNNALDMSGKDAAENVIMTFNFDYIEIPLKIRYRVIDKQLGVNLITGISTNWLIGNNVLIGTNGSKEKIGKTGNIENINYSGLLGVGFDYNLFSRIKLNMEPTFKYFLDPVNANNALNTHPYSFGIYTGFTYSF